MGTPGLLFPIAGYRRRVVNLGASLSTASNGPREIRFRWRTDDENRDAVAAKIERLRDEGKRVISIACGDPDFPDTAALVAAARALGGSAVEAVQCRQRAPQGRERHGGPAP